MAMITCIDDLQKLYHKRVPKMFRDYAESGSWAENTLRDNVAAFSRYKLMPRVLVDIDQRSIQSTILGEEVTMPVALAPVGLTGMQCADGEIKAARAAEAFGVPYCLSTMSICSIEDVAEATTKPFWFQLYVMRDRQFITRLIARAKEANCSALIVTADLPIMGQRHRDIINGLSIPPRPTLKNLLDILQYPGWALGMAQTRRFKFGNIAGHVSGTDDLDSLSRWTATQFDPTLTWEDIRWIRDQWPGKLVIKGIMDERDARHAVNAGADAIVVSNHGGRQLDSASASLDRLAPIVATVGSDIEVWVDGGIRSGQDVTKALALGAQATMVGRAYIYGLGALGQAGVSMALDIISREIDGTMALCGVKNIQDISDDILCPPDPSVRR